MLSELCEWTWPENSTIQLQLYDFTIRLDH